MTFKYILHRRFLQNKLPVSSYKLSFQPQKWLSDTFLISYPAMWVLTTERYNLYIVE